MEGEMKNLIRVWLAITASLCYCHSISAKLPKGKWRLVISLAPIIYIFSILPLYLASAFFTTLIAFFITWLANSKLLLFEFDQGPISQIPLKSLPIFNAIAALPFKIKPENNGATPQKPNKLLPLNLATEIPVSLILIQTLKQHKQFIHPYIVLVVYCCLMFLLVEILVARVLFGMELEPPSDQPYLSASLREFWGRRWNPTVVDLLRQTIHKPIRSALRGDWAALPAVLATFLVSGDLFWYVTRAKPS